MFLNNFIHIDNGAPAFLQPQRFARWSVDYSARIWRFIGASGQQAENLRVLADGGDAIWIVPMLVLLNLPFSYGVLIPVAFLGGLCASITGPNVRAVLQNCNLPETRGTVFALFALTDDLGKAFGPFLIAAFVTALGRRAAFNLATCAWFFCGVLLLGLSFTMTKDEQAVLDKVAEARRGKGAVELGVIGKE